MRIVHFPDRATHSFKASIVQELVDTARAELQDHGLNEQMISSVLDNVSDSMSDVGAHHVDLSRIDQDLYLTLLSEFPCFDVYPLPARIEQIYDDYVMDQLSDEQDVVFEFLMDLTGPYESGCAFSECLSLLDDGNRQALVRALGIFVDAQRGRLAH